MVKSLTNPLVGRATPLGTLLAAAGRRLASDLDAELTRAGFQNIRAAHAPLFMAIDPDGSTATALAQRTHMTKQAMGDLIRHLINGGYVAVSTAENDRRARTVTLTDRGRQALEAGAHVVADFDSWLATEIGEPQVASLRDTLNLIITTTDWPTTATKSRETPDATSDVR